MTSSSVVVALGSNLGDRGEHITEAANQIGAIDGVELTALSKIVESFALTVDGVDETKPKYLNAVALLETSLEPEQLLSGLQGIEREHGRVRGEKWGSRTLDLDIIAFGDLQQTSAALTIPHPRAHERAFVMVPWAQVDSAATLPGHGSVSALASTFAEEVWFI